MAGTEVRQRNQLEYFMAQYEEFTIDQGSDVTIKIHCTDENGDQKNLAGFAVNAKLKKNYNSDSSDTHSFTTSINSPTTAGIIQLTLPNATTDILKAGRYVYDVEMSFQDSDSTTIVERILEGRPQVTPSVTK